MAEHDLIIRRGQILDGSRGAPFVGDVAISDGLIAAVGFVSAGAAEEIDAEGLLVMPGFVDIHTHYDGQVTWENQLRPSSEHGVTTVVMGNCGVGFAPCKRHEHDLLVKVMREELFALADGLRRAGKGVFQVAAALANQQLASVIPGAAALTPNEAARQEVDLFVDLCRASGRPIMFALSLINDMPSMALQVLELIGEANKKSDVNILAQVFPRPIGIWFGLDLSLNPFKLHPSYGAIEHLTLADRVQEMRKPHVRARILADGPDPDHPNPIERFLVMRSLGAYPFTSEPDYEPDPATSLQSMADQQKRNVYELAYDALLEADGTALLFLPINNFPGSLDLLGNMLESEDTVIGLGDGGAHLGLICDASYPTFFLSYWTRDRRKGNGCRFNLPDAVNRLTRRPAVAVGLNDRGLISPGMKADINIISYDKLRLGLPEVVFDLPGGGKRLIQKVDGIEATILNGIVTFRHGLATGALSGSLVRPSL